MKKEAAFLEQEGGFLRALAAKLGCDPEAACKLPSVFRQPPARLRLAGER